MLLQYIIDLFALGVGEFASDLEPPVGDFYTWKLFLVNSR